MSLKSKLFVAFMLAASAVAGALGLWQWNRRAEKAAFITGMEKAATSPAIAYADAPLWSHVTITGRLLHQHTAFVRTSRRQGGQSVFGVEVFTPMATRICTAEGRCTLRNVYVNRGFLPTAADGKIPAFERPEEPVSLSGFLRPAEVPSLIQPSDDPARRLWFSRNTAAMARAAELPGADAAPSPYDRYIEREASAGEAAPFGLDARALLAAIPDNHLIYAMTWWGLMLTGLGVLMFSVRRRKEEA